MNYRKELALSMLALSLVFSPNIPLATDSVGFCKTKTETRKKFLSYQRFLNLFSLMITRDHILLEPLALPQICESHLFVRP